MFIPSPFTINTQYSVSSSIQPINRQPTHVPTDITQGALSVRLTSNLEDKNYEITMQRTMIINLSNRVGNLQSQITSQDILQRANNYLSSKENNVYIPKIKGLQELITKKNIELEHVKEMYAQWFDKNGGIQKIQETLELVKSLGGEEKIKASMQQAKRKRQEEENEEQESSGTTTSTTNSNETINAKNFPLKKRYRQS